MDIADAFRTVCFTVLSMNEEEIMFNKPNIFGRNEADQRRDAAPVRNPAVKVAAPVPEMNPNRTAVPARSAADHPVAAARPVTPAVEVPVLATSVAPKESSDTPASDHIMGARLIVGPEVKLKGAEILDCDTLVVEGRVEATMDSRVVRIAENGAFVGKVSIDIAEIHGVFEGELTARSQLIIHSTGRVSGKIRYGKLVADEGCELCGDVNVLSESPVSKLRTVTEPLVALSAAG
jgi:cytoskeletal protein CcmA (bactofilin family)